MESAAPTPPPIRPAPEPPPAASPEVATEAPAPPPIRRRRRTRPPNATAEEALNVPSVALYIAERLDRIDQIVTLRVTAEKGAYFNCYYKDRTDAYHHFRLRGDGSSYLDGYVPRDGAGERLWVALNKQPTVRLTVQVVMRPETISGICIGQVEVLDHREGWDYSVGGLAEPGALPRRLANSRDRTLARNRQSIATFLGVRDRLVDKGLTFRVRARLDRYYQCRYRDAERTHYSLLLQGDGFKGLRAYARRDGVGREIARYLATNEGAAITVDVVVPRGRFDTLCPDQVELLRWRDGW